MAVSDFPRIDFSILTKYPELYEAGQQRSRADAFSSGLSGLPRGPNGEIDMKAAIQLALRTGNIRSLEDLIRAQGIYGEEQARRDAANFGNLFAPTGGAGAAAQPPAQNMIPGNRAPILDTTGFRTSQAELPPDVAPGTERPMELPRTAASGPSSYPSGTPDDFGSATFTSEPRTRLAYGGDGATATDLPPIFTKPAPVRTAQAGGGAYAPASDLSGGFDPGARPVRTESIRPPAAATTGQQARPPSGLPSLTDASRVPAIMAALRSKRLPEGQRQAAMLYLRNIFEADNPTAEMRNVDFVRRNPHLKDLYLELKRAGSPQTNLSTVEGWESAQRKAQLGLDEGEAKAMQAKVITGRDALPLLNHIMQIADKIPGGWRGSVTPAIARALSGMGVPVSEGMAMSEAFASMSRSFIPAVREPGPTSQQEGVWYFEAVPGLAQSPEGRKKIADIMRRQIVRHNELYGIVRANLGNPDLQKKLQEANEKPLFSQAEYDEMDALIKQGGGQPPDRPLSPREYINLPRPQSSADYDNLPVGTKYLTPDGQVLTKKPPPGGAL